MNEVLVDYLAVFTTVVAILSLSLGVEQRLANFPVSIVITLLNMVVYYYRGRYDRCFSGVAAIVMSCYGWYRWRYGGQGGQPLVRMRATTPKEGLVILLMALPCWYLFWQVLIWLEATQTLGGSIDASLVLLGLWMTADKRVETYLIWFMVSIVSFYNNYVEAHYYFAFKYVIYLAVSVHGFHVWWAQYQRQRKAEEQ